MLLAEVHALLGHRTLALKFSYEMQSFFLSRPDTPDWEVALTHAIFAHCAHQAGDATAHRTAYDHATAALAAIKDTEDRDIVAKTYGQIPKP